MISSYTYSGSTTFTATHARHIAAKVASDLKRMQRFYGEPSDHLISWFEEELIHFLPTGYLSTVAYGFQRKERWIEPTLIYTARELEEDAHDHDPGRVRPGADTRGASFHSYLTRSIVWELLPESEKRAFEEGLPFQRNGAPEPGVSGFLQVDRTYSAGGRGLMRSSVRAF